MAIPYSKPEAVKILDSQNLTVQTFNQAIARFIQNDLSLVSRQNVVPGTWENRWYNSPLDSQLYYKKGDAVWINCEDPLDFIHRREADIVQYVKSNPATMREYERLSKQGDLELLQKFYLKVLDGYNGNPPLFYLGDLSKPIQIRISLVDGNNRPPSDMYTASAKGDEEGMYWKDFFTSQTKSEIVEQIYGFFRGKLAEQSAKHLEEYHMDGLTQPESFMVGHLRKNFTNMVYRQKMKSHYWYDSKLEDGFDSVVRYVRKDLQSGGVQWFRQWKSGYLEHGGIVGPEDIGYGGVKAAGDLFLRVNFKWYYGNTGQSAPEYNYPTDLQSKQYLPAKLAVDVGHSFSTPYDVEETNRAEFPISRMGSVYKYSLSVNPVLQYRFKPLENGGDSVTDQVPQPYSQMSDPKNLKYYSPKEVYNQDNGGFNITVNSESPRYSYYASGFVS